MSPVSTSLHIDFLRRPERDDVVAHAVVLRLGKTLGVVDVSIHSAQTDILVAKAQVTLAIPGIGKKLAERLGLELKEKLAGFTAAPGAPPAKTSLVDDAVGALLNLGYKAVQAEQAVEKAVRAGAHTLVTISLPTSLAVARAQAAGLSLWVLARGDSVLLAHDGAQPG